MGIKCIHIIILTFEIFRLCRLAEKLLLKARDEVLAGDEEQAYVLYMRFVDVFQSVRNSKAYRTEKKELDKLVSPAKASKALGEAERLSKNLKERYVLSEPSSLPSVKGSLCFQVCCFIKTIREEAQTR